MQKVKDENGMPNDLTLQIFFIGSSHKEQKKWKDESEKKKDIGTFVNDVLWLELGWQEVVSTIVF